MIKQFILAHEEFIDNEWLDKYVELIENNKNNVYEKNTNVHHHIIPKCYFNLHNIPIDNSSNNIVVLNYKDHMLAHYYISLCTMGKIHDRNSYTLRFVWGKKKIDPSEIEAIDLEEFERLYKEGRKITSERLKEINASRSKEWWDRQKEYFHNLHTGRVGINNGIEYKLVRPEELDKYLSEGWVKGCIYDYTERTKKISKALKGYDYGEEFREKCRRGKAGKIVINNTKDKSKYVTKEEFNEIYKPEGWVRGRLKKNRKEGD